MIVKPRTVRYVDFDISQSTNSIMYSAYGFKRVNNITVFISYLLRLHFSRRCVCGIALQLPMSRTISLSYCCILLVILLVVLAHVDITTRHHN